jgi:cytochrome bd-type quinol oxidase subunit 2
MAAALEIAGGGRWPFSCTAAAPHTGTGRLYASIFDLPQAPGLDAALARKVMVQLFLLALVVGAACGAVLGYEMRPRASGRNSWPHWAGFAGAAVVVSLCALAAERINQTEHPSATVKAVCVLAVVASLALAVWRVSSRR